MPEPIITMSPEEDDLQSHHDDDGTTVAATTPDSQHGKAHTPKPVLELAVAQDRRPYRSQVTSNIDIAESNDPRRQQLNSAAAGSLGSSTDLPEVISEQDEETPSEGEPLTPSDSSVNIFQHHQQRNDQDQHTGSSSPTACGSSSLNGSTVQVNGNGNNGNAATKSKPDAIHITPPDQDHQYSHDAHDDSSCYSPQPQQQPPTPPVRSPRTSQFFSNPFSSSSSASILRQPTSASKPARHTSFRGFFRRNSSALTQLQFNEDVSGNPNRSSSQNLQPAAAADASAPVLSSPVSSVAAESGASGSSAGAAAGAGAGASGTGTSPTESKFRFGLKRRQSPQSYADNNNTANNNSNSSHSNSNSRRNSRRGTPGPAPSNPYQPRHASTFSSGQEYTPIDRCAAENDSSSTSQNPRKQRHSNSHPSVHLGHLKERSKILFGNMPKPVERLLHVLKMLP
ncbi:chorismate mutase aro7 [Ascosphaera pollenicola]|nr:chorismate mutase aro7 [Ascosphaera pollenicola]